MVVRSFGLDGLDGLDAQGAASRVSRLTSRNRDRFATPFWAKAGPHRTRLRRYAEPAFARGASVSAETLLRIAAERRPMREAFPRGLRREAIAFRFARGDDTAAAPATTRKVSRGVGRCPPPPARVAGCKPRRTTVLRTRKRWAPVLGCGVMTMAAVVRVILPHPPPRAQQNFARAENSGARCALCRDFGFSAGGAPRRLLRVFGPGFRAAASAAAGRFSRNSEPSAALAPRADNPGRKPETPEPRKPGKDRARKPVAASLFFR